MLQKCLRGKIKTPKQQYTADPPKALGIPLSCSIWEHKGFTPDVCQISRAVPSPCSPDGILISSFFG